MSGFDSVVVGAGVIGLAIARALAKRGRQVLLLDAASHIGKGVSSRSSEVVHGGLYYTPGSLKARLCVAGKAALYDYCEAHAVGHRRCGKLLVAADAADWSRLETIRETARANGVTDIQPLTADQALALEPALQCWGAMLSPSTGIVDSHGLMLAFLGDLEDAGGMFARGCHVERVDAVRDGFTVHVAGEADAIGCREVINAAGLGAVSLAQAVDGLPPETIPIAHFAKGQYFRVNARVPFSRLIYPVPQPGGLGIHLSLDLAGQARFGPDVHWVAEPEYTVDVASVSDFESAIRRYWPALETGSLQPDYAGVRPKIVGPGEPAADFCISTAEQHGVPGYVGLYGMESPGLTASLAIGEHVLDGLG